MTRLLIYIFVAAMAAVASAQGLTARDGAKAYSKHLEYLDSNPDSAAYYMGEAARLMPDSAAMQIMAGKYFADCQGDYARAMDYFSRAMGWRSNSMAPTASRWPTATSTSPTSWPQPPTTTGRCAIISRL